MVALVISKGTVKDSFWFGSSLRVVSIYYKYDLSIKPWYHDFDGQKFNFRMFIAILWHHHYTVPRHVYSLPESIINISPISLDLHALMDWFWNVLTAYLCQWSFRAADFCSNLHGCPYVIHCPHVMLHPSWNWCTWCEKLQRLLVCLSQQP